MEPTATFVLVVTGVFGAMLGSFFNVVIHRMPQRKSIVWPGSHCPACSADIRWFDNLPVLSYLLLGGKCRSCKGRISLRYPLIEALTAGLAVIVAWRFLLGPAGLRYGAFFAAMTLTGALVPVTFIDLAHRIIPDRITKPGMVAAPILSMIGPEIHRISMLPELSPAVAALLLSLCGMAAGAGTIWFMGFLGKVMFRKEAMGFGDVKFMGMVGGFLGPVGVLLAVLIACVLGSVVGIGYRVVTGKSYIPFGPFLSAGALGVLFFRAEVVEFVTVTYPAMFR